MKYKYELTVKRTVLYVLMIFFALLAVIPIYLMLINATRTNAQINSGISLLPGNNTLQNWKNSENRWEKEPSSAWSANRNRSHLRAVSSPLPACNAL